MTTSGGLPSFLRSGGLCEKAEKESSSKNISPAPLNILLTRFLISHRSSGMTTSGGLPSFLRSDGLCVKAEKESHCISVTDENRSLRLGFNDFINSSFHTLFHFLSCFSLLIASSIELKNW